MFQSLISLLLAKQIEAQALPRIEAPRFDDRVLLSVESLPLQQDPLSLPGSMSAKAVLAIDLESQAVLFQENSYAKVPIASLTKLMTAYIILNEKDTETVVTVSPRAASETGSRMGLYNGEQIKVKDLLYGMLIKSGNDAAVALAEHHSGSEAAFVEHMNKRAAELGLDATYFEDASGLSNNYSSAKDLAALSSRLVRYDAIREIVHNKTYTVTSIDGYEHKLTNTNIILGQLGIIGLKTGKTPAAGECLISLARTAEGKEVLSVVLGSENRFADTKIFLEWIYNNFTW